MGSLWKDGIAKDERAQERRRLEERLKWSQHLDPTGQEHTGLSHFGEFCQCLLALSPREACKSTRIPYCSIKCLQKNLGSWCHAQEGAMHSNPCASPEEQAKAEAASLNAAGSFRLPQASCWETITRELEDRQSISAE